MRLPTDSNSPPRYRIHPTFHVSLLKPCSSPTPDQHEPDEPPPPEILDQPSVYQVRNIMDSRRRDGRLEYLMDWEGYRPKEQSWVARDDILDPMLLQEFHNTHPNRPTPRGRGRPHRSVRASGAAPGGGGSVRESQSQSPPPTTITRSQSPEFLSPAPATPNQHLHKYHTLSDTHRPVYGSLPWTIPDSPFSRSKY